MSQTENSNADIIEQVDIPNEEIDEPAYTTAMNNEVEDNGKPTTEANVPEVIQIDQQVKPCQDNSNPDNGNEVRNETTEATNGEEKETTEATNDEKKETTEATNGEKKEVKETIIPVPVVDNRIGIPIDTEAYIKQLKKEIEQIPNNCELIKQLIENKILRLEQGEREYCEPHTLQTQMLSQKIYIPIKEFPDINLIGKILGVRGSNLQKIQRETKTKLTILGRGTIRPNNKKEELDKKVGKTNMNEQPHILIETTAHVIDGARRISSAVCWLSNIICELTATVPKEQVGYSTRTAYSGSNSYNGNSYVSNLKMTPQKKQFFSPYDRRGRNDVGGY
ncbi:hypothetical protein A3Q56_06346 [Intoshia linei]|uniref:KHDC4/BBP-like KH-domain type I domain-containing protein n=1 Tax=Intoshia linei TaxID=1819745 RepID=A0A177AVC0_9BILA|nr:hypothetical protein A3Q56_06346 [Intoshia linei]